MTDEALKPCGDDAADDMLQAVIDILNEEIETMGDVDGHEWLEGTDRAAERILSQITTQPVDVGNADIIVPCWGNVSKIPKQHRKRARLISEYINTFDVPVKCFGLTKSGDPKHPLMLGYNTPLIDYAPALRKGGV